MSLILNELQQFTHNNMDIIYRKQWNQDGKNYDVNDLHWSAYTTNDAAYKYSKKYNTNINDIIQNTL